MYVRDSGDRRSCNVLEKMTRKVELGRCVMFKKDLYQNGYEITCNEICQNRKKWSWETKSLTLSAKDQV